MVEAYTNPNANVEGVVDERYGGDVIHYRGLKYGSIEKRFDSPRAVSRNKSLRQLAVQYGPRCPQTPMDVRELLQIPRNLSLYERVKFDEFECLNVNITAPKDAKPGSLPVVIWIHGGSQIVTFPAADERLGDPGPLVAQSVSSQRPFILVTFNHRLNIFAYGDNNGPKNLQLQDCSLLCAWVRNNIRDFGGDPHNITLTGESAGAILAHALLVVKTPGIKRAILSSGTLYTSPPKAAHMMQPILDRVIKRSREIETMKKNPNASKLTLRDISVRTLMQAQAESFMTTIWLQEHTSLATWQDHTTTFANTDLMIGDTEFETILWLAPSKIIPEKALAACFTNTTKPNQPIAPSNAKLSKAYLENPTNTANKSLGMIKAGTLDFVTDDHFAFPNYMISNLLRSQHKNVYQYIFEEVNPFAAASKKGIPRAHHAIDNLALFGGYENEYPDHPSFTHFRAVSEKFRQSWIDFAAGGSPWSTDKILSFGHDGKVGELREGEYANKRRTEHFKVLEEVGREVYDAVWTRIAATADVVIEKVAEHQRKVAIEAAKKKKELKEVKGSKI